VGQVVVTGQLRQQSRRCAAGHMGCTGKMSMLRGSTRFARCEWSR
jgi:hypothetical protein